MTEQEWLKCFSEALIQRIGESGYSRKEVADMAGMTEGALSKYVRGLQIPKSTAVLNLAYALECDVADLMDFGDDVFG